MPFRPSTETDKLKVAEDIHQEDERSHQWAADISYLTAVVPSLPSSIPHELHNISLGFPCSTDSCDVKPLKFEDPCWT